MLSPCDDRRDPAFAGIALPLRARDSHVSDGPGHVESQLGGWSTARGLDRVTGRSEKDANGTMALC